MTAAEAVAKRATEVRLRRHREATDALDFLVYGDDEGRHAEKCVHALNGGTPCLREYDPSPYPEAAPTDPRLYEGTGIAALYGIPGGEAHAWQLAGWNLVPRSTRGRGVSADAKSYGRFEWLPGYAQGGEA